MSEKKKVRIWWTDIPDPDVIRVGDAWYMTSTTMHFTPGCPVMKSKDLIRWEIVSYVYDILEDSDEMALRHGKHDYGRGSWASCIRHSGSRFYTAFAAYNANKTYVFQTGDIEKSFWERSELPGIYHDLSLLFDDDGRVYMVYGSGVIRVLELTSDARAVKPGGLDKVIIPDTGVGGGDGLPAEGAHIYKKDGRYYIFLIAWPKEPPSSSRRIELCYRSDRIDGVYEGRVVLDCDMGFYNRGVAQGGIFEAFEGTWYSLLFQDHGAVGRIPVLVPVSWEDGWPVFGTAGRLPAVNTAAVEMGNGAEVVKSDEFDAPSLALQWQWNHNSDSRFWSLEEKPGWLTLTNGRICRNLSDAPNTLTQRTQGPVCSGCVLLDASKMRDGDFAGLAAFQDQYGYVGIRKTEDCTNIIMAAAGPEPFDPSNMKYETGKPEVVEESIPFDQENVFLRIDFDFNEMADTADFFYSLDGSSFHRIGRRLYLSYRLTHFVGYRFALFSYGTKETGGSASFDFFRVF